MTRPGPALAQSWCALSALHDRIEAHVERALQEAHGLSVREYSVLDVLSQQHKGPRGHFRMNELADAVDRLSEVPGVAAVILDRSDIVRHPLVQAIVDAYEEVDGAAERQSRREAASTAEPTAAGPGSAAPK